MYPTIIKQKKSRSRKLDVGDYAYVEPFAATRANTIKARKRASQVGVCTARKSYVQSLIFTIKFDDGLSANFNSPLVRRATKDNYEAFKSGTLSIFTVRELADAKSKVLADLLFDKLAKMGLKVTTDGKYRVCKITNKYNAAKLGDFYIKEEYDNYRYSINYYLPCALVINYAYCLIPLLLNASTNKVGLFTNTQIKEVISTVKKYINTKYVVGINKMENMPYPSYKGQFNLNEHYNLHSVNDEPAISYTYSTDSLISIWCNNGGLYREGDCALINGNKKTYILEGKPVKEDFFRKRSEELKFNKELASKEDAIFDNDFLDGL